MSMPNRSLGRSRTWPMVDTTSYLPSRYFSIVLAFAGDSTTISRPPLGDPAATAALRDADRFRTGVATAESAAAFSFSAGADSGASSAAAFGILAFTLLAVFLAISVPPSVDHRAVDVAVKEIIGLTGRQPQDLRDRLPGAAILLVRRNKQKVRHHRLQILFFDVPKVIQPEQFANHLRV